jgi:hypothetical protein
VTGLGARNGPAIKSALPHRERCGRLRRLTDPLSLATKRRSEAVFKG